VTAPGSPFRHGAPESFRMPGEDPLASLAVTRTDPYFHDGSVDTLEDAVRIMTR